VEIWKIVGDLPQAQKPNSYRLASAMSGLPGIGKFLPGSLVQNTGQIIKGQPLLWEPSAGSIAIIVTALLVSALAFHKWEP